MKYRELVVKIPEEVISFINIHGFVPEEYRNTVNHVFLDATELPSGHGRLLILSENVIEANKVDMSFSTQRWISEVGLSHATVGIIDMEADKKDNDDYKCKNCSKAYTDDCPKEKCWKNNYSEFIEENK